MVTSPSTPNLLFAGSPNAMLYRSADGGASWSHLSFPAELASSLHVILPHPAEAGRILTGVSPDSGGSGLFISEDGGESWRGVEAFNQKAVWALAHFAGDARIMVAGASDGVYRSADAGHTWRRISPFSDAGLKPVVSVAIHPKQSDVIYAGTPHLPWRTANGGRTWQSIHRGMLDDSDVFSIDIDARNPEHVLASACSGIYRSLTGGALWAKLRGSADASFRTYVIAHDPHAAGRVWAGTTHGLMRSEDGGTSWRTASKHSVKSIAFDPRNPGTVFLATRDSGLVKTSDGASFALINQGFANRSFFSLAAAGDSLWLSGDGIGTVTSADGGRAWQPVAGNDRVLTLASCGENQSVFAAGATFFRQFLAQRWVALTQPRHESVRSAACLGSQVLAVTGRAAYRSADAGRTWIELPKPNVSMEWNQIAASAAGSVLAATSHGLLRSSDAGQTWAVAPGQLGQATVTGVIPHPERRGQLFAAQYDRLFISSDDGLQWTPIETRGLERAAVRALAVTKGKPGRLYALVAGRGVFYTDWE